MPSSSALPLTLFIPHQLFNTPCQVTPFQLSLFQWTELFCPFSLFPESRGVLGWRDGSAGKGWAHNQTVREARSDEFCNKRLPVPREH